VFTGNTVYSSDNTWTLARNFDNGHGVYSETTTTNIPLGYQGLYEGRVLSTTTTGAISEIINNTNHKTRVFENMSWRENGSYIGLYSEGLFYYSDKDVGGSHQGFYDIRGTQIINLLDLNRVWWAGGDIAFIGDYCIIRTRNNQGSEFYVVINKTGEMLFEPKKYEHNISLPRCGMLVIKQVTPTTVFTIMTVYGELVSELTGVVSVSEYFEDIALVVTGNEVYYIDKAGNRLFNP
jgi:hypothetical protein